MSPQPRSTKQRWHDENTDDKKTTNRVKAQRHKLAAIGRAEDSDTRLIPMVVAPGGPIDLDKTVGAFFCRYFGEKLDEADAKYLRSTTFGNEITEARRAEEIAREQTAIRELDIEYEKEASQLEELGMTAKWPEDFPPEIYLRYDETTRSFDSRRLRVLGTR